MFDETLIDPNLGTRVKVCGIAERPGLDTPAAAQLDFQAGQALQAALQ